MLFNSIEFAIFLPVVFLLYWLALKGNLKLQNLFLLAVSYFFYGWWDWRFLGLIALSSALDFWVGQGIYDAQNLKMRKHLLFLSIAFNLGMLGFFKYYNFFVQSFIDAFTLFGTKLEIGTLNILLPVGISFYTFQTLSYTIDIYRGKLEPSREFIPFFSFVSFFPQLVAGPIERAKSLLPQFHTKREFDIDRVKDGLRQILWGLFKKIVIADNCALFANEVFASPEAHSGITLLLGAIFFAFQIYGDFSGYSDIAIGTARIFGFELMQNFATPYFARDVAEFWRRWHISLSTWFRDYLYIPLGGSRVNKLMVVRNTSIIFLVSGFWHGANWTFIVWGAIHAILFLPLILHNRNRKNVDAVAEGRFLPNPKELFQMLSNFLLVCLGWIFFRAASLSDAFAYIDGLFSLSFFSFPSLSAERLITLSSICLLIVLEWRSRKLLHPLADIGKAPIVLRWISYLSLVWGIFSFGGQPQSFIYFQF